MLVEFICSNIRWTSSSSISFLTHNNMTMHKLQQRRWYSEKAPNLFRRSKQLFSESPSRSTSSSPVPDLVSLAYAHKYARRISKVDAFFGEPFGSRPESSETLGSVEKISAEIDSVCAAWHAATSWVPINDDPWVKSKDPWALPPLKQTASLGSPMFC